MVESVGRWGERKEARGREKRLGRCATGGKYKYLMGGDDEEPETPMGLTWRVV